MQVKFVTIIVYFVYNPKKTQNPTNSIRFY